MKFENVTVLAEANIYFEGNVVSHTIVFPDGSKKTLGVILPGSYHFGTGAAELMEIAAGSCSYVIDGTEDSTRVSTGGSFEIPANSGFTITVGDGPCHYVCSYLS